MLALRLGNLGADSIDCVDAVVHVAELLDAVAERDGSSDRMTHSNCGVEAMRLKKLSSCWSSILFNITSFGASGALVRTSVSLRTAAN